MACEFDAYTQLPPSPTLTNPDMILPFDPHTFTPSPPRTGPIPLILSSPRTNDYVSYGYTSGNGRRPNHFSTKSTPPASNRLSSALSDIEEVETTPKKPSYIVNTIASSPTLRESGSTSRMSDWRAARRERPLSDASSSVVTDDLEDMQWRGFDSGEGIEEESIESEDEAGTPKTASFRRGEKLVVNDDDHDTSTDERRHSSEYWQVSRPSDEDDEDDDPLSKRADMILANAKKRLNVLEGNLRGARHSLLTAPASRSTPYLSVSTSGLRDRFIVGTYSDGRRSRQYSSSPISSVSSFGHARNQSETDAFSPTPKKSAFQSSKQQVRAASALGSFAGGLSSLERSISLRGVRSQEVMRESRLQSWMEEAPMRQPSPERDDQSTRSPAESVRSTSALDLRTQMDELKGRISSLRDRAAEEKIKRLSTSSLRTPSPYSATEAWYTDGEAYKNHAMTSDAGVGWSPDSSPVASKAFSLTLPKRTVGSSAVKSNGLGLVGLDSAFADDQSQHTEDEYQHGEDEYQNAEETLNELVEESLQADEMVIRAVVSKEKLLLAGQGQDSPVEDYDEDELDTESMDGHSEYFEAVAERHEDRADAFDYEHFFLHSAMGSFSRARSASFSSEGSIETTRAASPPRPATAVQTQPQAQDTRLSSLQLRNKSVESLSTVASFQTALETGGSSRIFTEGHNRSTPSYSTYSPHTEQEQIRASLISKSRPSSGVRFDSAFQMTPPRSSPNALSPNSTPSMGTASPREDSPAQRSKSNGNLRPISLISSFLELESPAGKASPRTPFEQDTALVADAIKSLQTACLNLQNSSKDDFEKQTWRRRLEAARRALDGECEPEAS